MSDRLEDPMQMDETLNTDEKPKKSGDGRKEHGLPTLYNTVVAEIFDFTPGDLGANQMGRISQRQTEKILLNLKAEVDAMWLVLMMMLGAAVLVGLIMTSGGLGTIYLVVGGGIVVGPMLLYSFLRQRRARRDIDTVRVKQTSGVPKPIVGRWGVRDNVAILVNDVELRISLGQFNQLSRYHIPYMKFYYTTENKRVLSAEVFAQSEDEKLKNDALAYSTTDVPDQITLDASSRKKHE